MSPRLAPKLTKHFHSARYNVRCYHLRCRTFWHKPDTNHQVYSVEYVDVGCALSNDYSRFAASPLVHSKLNSSQPRYISIYHTPNSSSSVSDTAARFNSVLPIALFGTTSTILYYDWIPWFIFRERVVRFVGWNLIEADLNFSPWS